MKIKMLKSTICEGKGVPAGGVVEASDRDANILIAYKRAVKFTEEPKKRGRKPKSDVNRMEEVEETRDAG